MKKILLCQDIHKSGRMLLEDKFKVIVAPDPKEETIRSMISDFEGLIVRTGSRIGKETIDAGRKLEVIGRTGAGVDNVDVETTTERGIPICYAPEANYISVTEHTISLVLALAKQLPIMDKSVREGRFNVRYEYLAVDVTGKTLGIVGFGRIGREVAKRCINGLDMKVVWYDPFVKDYKDTDDMKCERNLNVLFENSDFVTIHLPHNKETHHIIGKSLFEEMKPSSYFINTSRGSVIDEAALIDVLVKKKIAGAGLDVFEKEPPDSNNPLLKLSNVILTPHSAALTKECVERMAIDTAQGVFDVLEGRKPRCVFNPECYIKS